MKIKKKKIFWMGLGGGGVRVDVNKELKFLKIHKKKFRGGVGGGGEGISWGVGRVGGGVRVDVNAMLGVGGDVGYGRCEPRIEGIVCTMYKKVLYNIK